MLEMKERLIVHNLHIDHATIRSELRYLIGAKVEGTIIWNGGWGAALPKTHWFMSGPGNNPAKTEWVKFLDGSRMEPNSLCGYNPDCRQVTLNRC